jgi:hypothetical protein
MEKIEFEHEVKIGETVIDTITVHPLTFVEMCDLWMTAVSSKLKPQTALQRARIAYQTHFESGGKRIQIDDTSLARLPIPVAKSIIAALDIGQGTAGTVANDGDGVTSSVIYDLGTPIGMKTSKGEDQTIKSLEFQASTYGEVEDILAADNDMQRTLELIRRLARPVGSKLTQLPAWAVDKLTVADGVTIMLKVLPRF